MTPTPAFDALVRLLKSEPTARFQADVILSNLPVLLEAAVEAGLMEQFEPWPGTKRSAGAPFVAWRLTPLPLPGDEK